MWSVVEGCVVCSRELGGAWCVVYTIFCCIMLLCRLYWSVWYVTLRCEV